MVLDQAPIAQCAAGGTVTTMSGSGESDTTHVAHSWVVLTMGDRVDELAAAIDSIPSSPSSTATEIIVVCNGASEAVVPAGVVRVDLPENVGIPAGRNIGADHAVGEVIVFFDDDAEVAEPAEVRRSLARFTQEPDLGAISFRLVDPESGETARRHVPRLGRSDPTVSGDVTSFLGGACAVRRAAFVEAGGLPGEFFYSLEETDLAWRLIDNGWRIAYDADVVLHHPRTSVARHGDGARRTARNRVLLARRLLPRALGPVYVANWFALSVLRTRRVGDLWSGTVEGLRAPVVRRPIRWSTVARLTRLGRPPII